MHGRNVDSWKYRATAGERNFMEQIKFPVFEAVLAMQM